MPMLHGIGGLLCESELETEGAKFCCCKLQTVILDFRLIYVGIYYFNIITV